MTEDCYLCPICIAPLQRHPSGKSYYCANRHSFDLAKEGYLNLLPVQHKHSIEPGDSKAMLNARREFLEAGFYEPMAKALAMMMNAGRVENQPLTLLDVGCGEGYYSRKITGLCDAIVLHGVDIAKLAVAAAAKKSPAARFAVASVKRLPYLDGYFDRALSVFAPLNEDELKRVLKPSGRLLVVTPGPRHLWQLKAFIYAEVREHAAEIVLPDAFEVLDTQRVSYQITVNPAQRTALLQMTPFAWKADDSVRHAMNRAPELTIETDFVLTLARKK